MHRYHRCQGFRYLRSQQLLFGTGVYGYRATNRGWIALCAARRPPLETVPRRRRGRGRPAETLRARAGTPRGHPAL